MLWEIVERGEVIASKARSDNIGIFENESRVSSMMRSFRPSRLKTHQLRKVGVQSGPPFSAVLKVVASLREGLSALRVMMMLFLASQ
jgi:hypothetical protein